MYKAYPEEYNFFPKTWVLPNESHDLRNHYMKNNTGNKKKLTYIVKPDGLCQGKGIFLSRNIDHIFDVTMNVKKNELLEEHQIDSERIGYVVQ